MTPILEKEYKEGSLRPLRRTLPPARPLPRSQIKLSPAASSSPVPRRYIDRFANKFSAARHNLNRRKTLLRFQAARPENLHLSSIASIAGSPRHREQHEEVTLHSFRPRIVTTRVLLSSN
ncbi:hypothetical protein N7494_005457 [Penicillium frequentans]|uniref:Uncharacterized protein n=1 Tax=Penicillium frequentans TaxID=3151616 RepID=A0AAD6CY65_9EURO|nr:hypothetical protein N7494_005457 [Penicillium glabrum]